MKSTGLNGTHSSTMSPRLLLKTKMFLSRSLLTGVSKLITQGLTRSSLTKEAGTIKLLGILVPPRSSKVSKSMVTLRNLELRHMASANHQQVDTILEISNTISRESASGKHSERKANTNPIMMEPWAGSLTTLNSAGTGT